jgi:hypothetical protein
MVCQAATECTSWTTRSVTVARWAGRTVKCWAAIVPGGLAKSSV